MRLGLAERRLLERMIWGRKGGVETRLPPVPCGSRLPLWSPLSFPAYQVLETCVKNCGHRFHILVASRDFIDSVLVKIISPKNNPPTIVQDKVLALIQVRPLLLARSLGRSKMGSLLNESSCLPVTWGKEWRRLGLDICCKYFIFALIPRE